MSAHPLSFDHIHLVSTDPDSAASWYAQKLGGEIVSRYERGGAPQIFVSVGDSTLIIRGQRDGESASEKRTLEWGVDHFGFGVAGDFDDYCARLKDSGVEFKMEPTSINETTRIAFHQGARRGEHRTAESNLTGFRVESAQACGPVVTRSVVAHWHRTSLIGRVTMSLRESNIQRFTGQIFDVLVVGGGINGAVSAAALASKGARVALVDRGDFAGFTSQHSSNLAWGGIKYMENYEFPLVRDLCMSRNELMRSYPSSVREIRFLTTVSKGFRHHPLAMLAGSWAYWLMGNGFTQPPRLLSRADLEREEPVVNTQKFAGCIEYSDAYLYDNDARFVFNFVRTALNRGAIAANYVESLGSSREGDSWRTRVRDVVGKRELEIRSRLLVNAAGAFVDEHNALSRADHGTPAPVLEGDPPDGGSSDAQSAGACLLCG